MPNGDTLYLTIVDSKPVFHRLDGPAISRADGTREWWVDGVRHREDGPAIETTSGHKEWWIRGEPRGGSLHNAEWNDGTCVWQAQVLDVSRGWGTTIAIHRDGGPAIIRLDGSKMWWCNNKQHREGGPAVEHSNGNKEWWCNNKKHRLDGPAIDNGDITNQWWEGGKLKSVHIGSIVCWDVVEGQAEDEDKFILVCTQIR
jgi:hypothetical protein